jgi:ferritin-like metal-binding protein YciE
MSRGSSSACSGLAVGRPAVEKPVKALMKDEIIKNCLQDYGTECFEVASYTSLIAAAAELGDQETVAACQQNLRQDQAMAERILSGIPMVTSMELEHAAVEAAS